MGCQREQGDCLSIVAPFELIAMHRLKRFPAWFFLLIVSALAAGCASGQRPPMPVPLTVFIKADANINPDSRGRPSPLKVVIYELKSSNAFESADFFSLSQDDRAVMGAELLEREEVFLQPGESRTLTRRGYPGTTHIGVVAEFRDTGGSVWRAVAEVPAAQAGIFSSLLGGPKEKAYQVLLDRRSVKIMPP